MFDFSRTVKKTASRFIDYAAFTSKQVADKKQAEDGDADLSGLRERFDTGRFVLKNRFAAVPPCSTKIVDSFGRIDRRSFYTFVEEAREGVGLLLSGAYTLGNWNASEGCFRKNIRLAGPGVHKKEVLLYNEAGKRVRAENSAFFINAGFFESRTDLQEGTFSVRKMSRSKILSIYTDRVQELSKVSYQKYIDGIMLSGHERFVFGSGAGRFSKRYLVSKSLKIVAELRKNMKKSSLLIHSVDLYGFFEGGAGFGCCGKKRKFRFERFLKYLKALADAGVDGICVDFSRYTETFLPSLSTALPYSLFYEISGIVRDYFTEAGITAQTGRPLIVVASGRTENISAAEKAVEDGKADIVLFGRSENSFFSFVDSFAHETFLGASAAFSGEQIPVRKKIAVVGSGPAGIQAAVLAARRGHDVTIFEKKSELGGNLITGNTAALKQVVGSYRKYLNEEVKKASADYQLKVSLNARTSPGLLKQIGFDTIVVESGIKQNVPAFSGIYKANVVFAVDLLQDLSAASSAKNIIVVGGGDLGCEVAYVLAQNGERQVRVVEQKHFFMMNKPSGHRGFFIKKLKQLGVDLMNCAKLVSIDDGFVSVKRLTGGIPDPYLSWMPVLPDDLGAKCEADFSGNCVDLTIEADLVVLATSDSSENSFYRECRELFAAPEILSLQNSFISSRLYNASGEAFSMGVNI
jgi:2-enoate reductase